MDYCIYVLSFNHPDLTERCMSSCLNFSQNVTLVHNGSNSENVSRLKQKFPNIKHFVIEMNRGFSGGANAALKNFLENQTANWLFFVTNDCEVLEIKTLPAAKGLHAPLIMKRKTELIDSLGGGLNSKKLSLFHVKEKSESLKNYYVPGTSWLLDRESALRAPKFLESLGTYWEDVLFSHECQKLGITLGQHSEIKLRHGIGKTCHKDPQYTSYLYRRNRWIVLNMILKLSLWQKIKLAIQDLSFSFRLLLKGDVSRAKLAFKAFVHGKI